MTVEEAVTSLNSGNVIGVPTDTIYGLSSLCEYGAKIYTLKARDSEKKLIRMVGRIEDIDIDDPILLAKMKEVWPGAVTLIFDYKGEMTSFRIPNEPNLLRLLKALDKPIYTTSANISGQSPVKSRAEFAQIFPSIRILNEDISTCKSNVPSEIYIYKNNQFERIR